MPVCCRPGNAARGTCRQYLVHFEKDLLLLIALLVALPSTSAQDSNPSLQGGENRTSPTGASDRIQASIRNAPTTAERNPASSDACLLPPLNVTASSSVSTAHLQVPANARKEYHRACVALQNKKGARAEEHLRNALEEYPKYSAAWVTLGQLLISEQRHQEGRSACVQARAADSNYWPAYLCLAEAAAHADDWGEVLSLSNRTVEIDPNSVIAFEYRAAANLNLGNLAEAEKSGLRAVEIDTTHREPRVHVVLARIYEAKHEPANAAAQLREYLKYAGDPQDVATVKEYLAELEKQPKK